MIFLIEQALRTTVTGINFIERYGGIVRPVTQIGEGEENSRFSNTFPVSCYVSVTDCFDGGRERDLVPDEAYKSVSYWEQRGGGDISQGGPNGNLWRVDQEMRFVCWLNLAKLGLSDCNAVDELELYLTERVHSQNGKVKTVDGYQFRLDISRFRPVFRSPQTVFGPYTYNDKEWAFSWPYGFFAVDFSFRAELAAGCIVEPTLGTEINCIQTW